MISVSQNSIRGFSILGITNSLNPNLVSKYQKSSFQYIIPRWNLTKSADRLNIRVQHRYCHRRPSYRRHHYHHYNPNALDIMLDCSPFSLKVRHFCLIGRRGQQYTPYYHRPADIGISGVSGVAEYPALLLHSPFREVPNLPASEKFWYRPLTRKFHGTFCGENSCAFTNVNPTTLVEIEPYWCPAMK